jgi:hypothetical protein
MRTASNKFNAFAFWLCFFAESAAVVGLSTVLPLRSAASFLVYFSLGIFYDLTTAGIVTWLSTRLGVIPFPLLESWWHGHFRPREAATRMLGAAGVGVANFILTIVLSKMAWHGLPKHHFAPHVFGTVGSAILEEIQFRAIIFVALIGLIRWVLRPFSRRAEGTAFWTANMLQALMFGGAHLVLGMSNLLGKPWYIRLPVSQTWGGVLLGCIFWKYGLESAIACHASYDLSFYVLGLL